MVFTSLKFILFITATVTVYFLFPKKYRWVWLLIASYFFYLSASIKYGVFLVFSTAVTYFAAIWMEKTTEKSSIAALPKEERKEAKKRLQKRKKLIVALAIILNFAVLFFIKYSKIRKLIKKYFSELSFRLFYQICCCPSGFPSTPFRSRDMLSTYTVKSTHQSITFLNTRCL